MSGFRRLSDVELDRLADEDLVAYVVSARGAGDGRSLSVAINVYCYRIYENVRGRVRMKMESYPDADIEQVTDAVLNGILEAGFAGESIGELRALTTTILDRRIADFYRSKRSRIENRPLVEEHGDDEEVWGDPLVAPEQLSSVATQELIDRALAELGDAHRAVVAYRLAGHPAREAADLVNADLGERVETPMSSQNVDQIFSRFRARMRDLLDEADDGGKPDQNANDDG